MSNRLRYVLAAASLTVFVSCVPHWLAPAPKVQLSPEPGVYGEPVFVEPDGDDGDRYFLTSDPDATRQEFDEFFGEYVREDVDLRVFVLASSGVQSEIERVRYIIEGTGPEIESPLIRQLNVDHFYYDIEWNAGAVEDDTTVFEALEFAVVSSTTGPLETWNDAEERGRVEHAWSVPADHSPPVTSPGPIIYPYSSGYAGDARWMTVFVRDEDKNVASFDSVHMSTRPAPASVYAGHDSGGTDSSHLNSLLPGSTASVSFNDVSGSFPAAITETLAVALGDVSGDGLADLAAVYESAGTTYAAWLPGKGDGTFAWVRRQVLWQESSAVTLPERDIYVADINEDGKQEIVVPTASMGIHVYRADGSRVHTLEGQVARLEFGDLDGNGETDIAGLLPGTSAAIRIWLSRDNEFQLIDQPWTPPSGSSNLTIGDLDADGYDDLLVADPVTLTDPSVQIYWGSGSGYLEPEPAEVWSDEGTNDVAVVDFDSNGTLDLVFGNEWSIGSRLYENLGDRTFSLSDTSTLPDTAYQVEVADIDGDGMLDLIERSSNSDTVRYLTIGGGTFGTAFVIATGSVPRDIAVGAFR